MGYTSLILGFLFIVVSILDKILKPTLRDLTFSFKRQSKKIASWFFASLFLAFGIVEIFKWQHVQLFFVIPIAMIVVSLAISIGARLLWKYFEEGI